MIVMAAMNEAQKKSKRSWNQNNPVSHNITCRKWRERNPERFKVIYWTSCTRRILRERDSIIRDKDSLSNEFILDMVESLKR